MRPASPCEAIRYMGSLFFGRGPVWLFGILKSFLPVPPSIVHTPDFCGGLMPLHFARRGVMAVVNCTRTGSFAVGLLWWREFFLVFVLGSNDMICPCLKRSCTGSLAWL